MVSYFTYSPKVQLEKLELIKKIIGMYEIMENIMGENYNYDYLVITLLL